jgi:hypothetical protein
VLHDSLKLAELTSGIGAPILGVGFGVLFSQWFASAAGFITAASAVVHGVGLWDKHRLEAPENAENGRWVIALYWICWLLLAGLVVFLLVKR